MEVQEQGYDEETLMCAWGQSYLTRIRDSLVSFLINIHVKNQKMLWRIMIFVGRINMESTFRQIALNEDIRELKVIHLQRN